MAEDPSNELEVMPVDAGLAFRTEMFLNNFIMGYWKPIVISLALILAIILVYGNYQNWYKGGQYETSDEIATVLRQFDKAHPNLIAPGSLLKPETLYYSQPLAIDGDEELRSHVKIAAEALEKIAAEGGLALQPLRLMFSRPSFIEFLETMRSRRNALTKASADLNTTDRATIELAMASSMRESGDVDGALTALQDISSNSTSAFAQQWALIERSRLLVDLDRADEAILDLQSLLDTHPTGATAELAESELEALGGTPATQEIPEPSEDAPETTVE